MPPRIAGDAALRDGGGGGGGAGPGHDARRGAVVPLHRGGVRLPPLLLQHPLPLRRLHGGPAPRRAPRAPGPRRGLTVQAAAAGAPLQGRVRPLLQGRPPHLLPRHRPAPARLLPHGQGRSVPFPSFFAR